MSNIIVAFALAFSIGPIIILFNIPGGDTPMTIAGILALIQTFAFGWGISGLTNRHLERRENETPDKK